MLFTYCFKVAWEEEWSVCDRSKQQQQQRQLFRKNGETLCRSKNYWMTDAYQLNHEPIRNENNRLNTKGFFVHTPVLPESKLSVWICSWISLIADIESRTEISIDMSCPSTNALFNSLSSSHTEVFPSFGFSSCEDRTAILAVWRTMCLTSSVKAATRSSVFVLEPSRI